MKNRLRKFPLLALCALFFLTPASFAAEPEGKTTAKDVTQKLEETGRTIKNYSFEQRDEAVRKAKATLDDLDARIERMDARIEKKWDKMDKSARKQAKASLNAMHRQRNDLAEWYGALKHSSADAWEQVTTGFVKSYQTLRDSFAGAKEKF
jgi:hypothetical protein